MVVVPYRPGFDGGFLVVAWDAPYEAFTLLGEYGDRDLLGDIYVVRVWVRPEATGSLPGTPLGP